MVKNHHQLVPRSFFFFNFLYTYYELTSPKSPSITQKGGSALSVIVPLSLIRLSSTYSQQDLSFMFFQHLIQVSFSWNQWS